MINDPKAFMWTSPISSSYKGPGWVRSCQASLHVTQWDAVRSPCVRHGEEAQTGTSTSNQTRYRDPAVI